MLRHVAMFEWSDEATAEEVAGLRGALARLPEQIPTIRAYTYGEDVGLREGNHDFVVVADFDDDEGFLTYVDHPAHKALAQDHIEPIRATSSRVQFHAGG